MKCSLYRHFDKDGHLLYVGVSLSAVNRLSQHRDASHWFQDISSVKIEVFTDRKAALEAERAAILKENPRHNLKRPTLTETRAAARESRDDLVRRIAQFNPLYSPTQVANLLGIGPTLIKRLIDTGEIGFINIGAKVRITGWQVIEFLEAATEKTAARTHVPTHKQNADCGGRQRKMAETNGGASP